MGNAYPKELRERAVRTHVEDGVSVKQTARIFKLGYSTLRRWIAEYKSDGRMAPLPDSGGRASQKNFEHHEQALLRWTQDNPDLTQLELAKMLDDEFGVSVCQATICNALARLDLTNKKNTRR